MIELAPASAEEYTPAPMKTSSDFVKITGNTEVNLDCLRPGREYLIKVEVKNVTGKYPTVRIGAKVSSLLVREDLQNISGKILLEQPLTISFQEIDSAEVNVRIFDLKQVEVKNIPASQITVDVFSPIPNKEAFYLGKSRLGRDRLSIKRINPLAFQLGHSKLGQAIINPPDDQYYWQDISKNITLIETFQGVKNDGISLKGDLGSAIIETYNGIDFRTIGITWGSKIRIYHWPTRRMLFSGTATSVHVQPGKTGDVRQSLEVVDEVSQLAGQMVYGRVDNPGETWKERINSLIYRYRKNYVTVPATPETVNNIRMGLTAYESNLVNHLDIVAATQNGAWWVTRKGDLCFCPGQPVLPAESELYCLTDSHTPRTKNIYYYDGETGFDSDNLITAVEIVNQSAKKEESGWQIADKQLSTISDKIAIDLYGYRTASLVVNAYDDADAYKIARDIIAQADATIPLKSASFNALDHKTAALDLDIMQPVLTQARGEKARAYIGSIKHRITSLTWGVDLEMLPKRERKN